MQYRAKQGDLRGIAFGALLSCFGKKVSKEADQRGERPDCHQWREEGGERVAAVGEGRRCFGTEDIRRVPQQEAESKAA